MNKDKQIGIIKETYQYDKFKRQRGNRDINKSTLRTLEKSIKQHGWQPIPILVNEKYEVCDGQHRLTFAKEHNLPIQYIVKTGLSPEDCIIINSKRKNWTTKDYVNHYAELGNEYYEKIRFLKESFDSDYTLILYALTNSTTISSGTKNMSVVNDGKLTFTEEQYQKAKEELEFIYKLSPYIKKIKGRKLQLNWALIIAYEWDEIDNKRLEKVIKEGYSRVAPPVDMYTSLTMIEDLYNYHSQKRVWFVKYYEENIRKIKR